MRSFSDGHYYNLFIILEKEKSKKNPKISWLFWNLMGESPRPFFLAHSASSRMNTVIILTTNNPKYLVL